MPKRLLLALVTIVTVSLAYSFPVRADERPAGDVEVLRNTVVNMLEALVRQGLLTREAASQLVADAQAKADADASARSAESGPQPGDIRVTYVPDIVKEEIKAAVKADLGSAVVADVKTAAREEGWGVPAALPGWVRNSRWSGDVRFRGEMTNYADSNAIYPDFQRINETGRLGPLLNTTDDRFRFLARATLGANFDVSPHAGGAIRLGTGNATNPVTRNQALGSYQRTFPLLLDEAYVRLGTSPDRESQHLKLLVGRFPSPWQATDMLWDDDVRFNGLALQYASDSLAPKKPRGLFATAGLFPIDEIDVSARDKWLVGAQLGFERTIGDVRGYVAGAWYQYENITGRFSTTGDTRFDATAPDFVQKGNTLFAIRSSGETALFGLAADYRLADVTAGISWLLSPSLQFDAVADYVKNLAYDENAVYARLGIDPADPDTSAAELLAGAERSDGVRFELRLGNPEVNRALAWRTTIAYQKLERDAVLDAFTDSDFHGGGTDAEGYVISAEFGLTGNTWARVRYLSADEIDNAPLAIDVLQIDVNTKF